MMYHTFTNKTLDEALNKVKILIIGDVMVDSYLWGSVDRISPEAPVPVLTVKKREKRLGGAGNVIMNVKALGCTPLIASVIGDDEDGRTLLHILDQHHIDNSGILVSSHRSTTVKHRIIGGTQHLLRVDSESDHYLNVQEREALLKKIQSLLPQCDVVLFQDYDKGVLSNELISQVVTWCAERGIPTVVDPKKRNFLNYHHTTLFKPNLKEIREGLQMEIQPDNKILLDKAAERLIELLTIKQAMITLSEWGVYMYADGKSTIIPAHKREIADVSGAGDTVISIAAACMALQMEPVLIAALSNLGGGIVCEQIGVVPIDKNKLLHEAEKSGLWR